MAQEYRWLNDKSFEGTSYGIPVVGNVQGILYNKRIWEEAGITDFPTTSQAFLDDLQAIKDSGAASVAPLYTNYKDSWALSQWEGWRGAVTANPDYVNEMTETDTPWTDESDYGRHRRHDLRRRRAGPHRGRPDHDRLGGAASA